MGFENETDMYEVEINIDGDPNFCGQDIEGLCFVEATWLVQQVNELITNREYRAVLEAKKAMCKNKTRTWLDACVASAADALLDGLNVSIHMHKTPRL